MAAWDEKGIPTHPKTTVFGSFFPLFLFFQCKVTKARALLWLPACRDCARGQRRDERRGSLGGRQVIELLGQQWPLGGGASNPKISKDGFGGVGEFKKKGLCTVYKYMHAEVVIKLDVDSSLANCWMCFVGWLVF